MNQFFQDLSNNRGEGRCGENLYLTRERVGEWGENSTDRNGSSSPLFSAFSRVLRLLRVSVTVKKKELPAEEFTSLATVSDKNSWGKDQTFLFSFSCSPCPSRSCLSRFSHQTLYPNIEGTRRHKSISLTETVVYRQLPLT